MGRVNRRCLMLGHRWPDWPPMFHYPPPGYALFTCERCGAEHRETIYEDDGLYTFGHAPRRRANPG